MAAGIEGRSYFADRTVGDALVQRYGPDGVLVWSRTLAVPNEPDVAYALATDTTGAIIVVTQTFSGGNTLWKLDAEGEPIWQIADAGSNGLAASALAIDGQDIIMSGGDGSTSAFVHRRDTNGTVIWELAGAALDAEAVGALGLVVAADGDIAIAGHRLPGEHAWLARVSGDGAVRWSIGPDGNVGWLSILDASGCCANGLERIIASDDGRVFALGGFGIEGGLGARIVEVDIPCDGGLLWQSRS